MAFAMTQSASFAAPMPARRSARRSAVSSRKAVSPKAFSDANLIICASNAALLSMGRFVFLPYQRAQVAKAGLPVQNGQTHAQAGDVRATEATFALKTNDPAGFTLVDVMAWGALGHAFGFAALATNSFNAL